MNGELDMETEFTTTLDRVEDYAFSISFDKQSIRELTVDEPAPLGNETGPNASRLLAGAVGHCLSASLLFCLQKSRIRCKHVTTKVHTTLSRNEAGRWRISNMKVDINATLENEEDRERMNRCLEIFEDYCVVTQSVRKGLNVEASVHT